MAMQLTARDRLRAQAAAVQQQQEQTRQQAVQELCARPDMARAIAQVQPEGLSPNKQMVANFVRGGHFFMLTQLYRLKNRI